MEEAVKRIGEALLIAFQYGNVDGAHHKAWTIDQIVRALTAEDYDAWIASVKNGEDGPATYGWDEGVPP